MHMPQEAHASRVAPLPFMASRDVRTTLPASRTALPDAGPCRRAIPRPGGWQVAGQGGR